MNTLFADSRPGRTGVLPKQPERRAADMLPASLLRASRPRLPELSELDVIRHFTRLSHLNYSVDANLYPLGSCTMKYNAKFMEYAAALPGFTGLHPLMAQLRGAGHYTQGALQLLWEMERLLCEITGMTAFTLQPMAGAHGEFTGAMLIAAYHRDKGNKKTKIIIPDSAHGTNPASATLAGFEVVNIPSKDGIIDPDTLEAALTDDVAALMMTCPNTLGLFENKLPALVEKLRRVDALLYYDGANMNAIMGKMRVGDVGFDVVHLNLHKTFGTPHGGGGPGAGPVGVSARLEPFLPVSRVARQQDGTFYLDYDRPKSIGYIAPFYGNFGVVLKAYAYILRLGREGLRRASEYAVLNANYLHKRLRDILDMPYERLCMHEFVASAPEGLRALDIAKAMLDGGVHAPTVYFPLIVPECLMFEPTETESKETLDKLVDLLDDIVKRGRADPDDPAHAPYRTPVRRLDETLAARGMVLTEDME
ncbi:MAG TPA: aminomethyl-transferring glycine dehydrogenase subunit GcvPB [Candidatus Mailhella merdigallinarum]|uniref:glycine dehydrogenase (aminomethyl-transferring) n=1 Tax=Candidatus Mailhella merdigallinarum TaxID=2838658 RepID=A0A9D2HGC6_9BACT|nr:aminomethyl-transferring glycine dehydrogenase subunit GcvPB [Desulfovibrionaceae bacterium]PWM70323.1 MAG: aminomethyl-transferring glycine dehydrogenase subunit GcvPB [Desulfovibrionaceae bacterium]HJA09320.1 aminomethyl-transferring glycine dehydrogenase subunit GcvPB [Candidatus Mailhella merdigallinarum]